MGSLSPEIQGQSESSYPTLAPSRPVPGAFGNFGAVGNAPEAAAYEVLSTVEGLRSTLFPESPESKAERERVATLSGIPQETFGEALRKKAKELTPDPLTTGMASNVVFEFGKAVTEIIGGGVIGRGVKGAAAIFGAIKGTAETQKLRDEGVGEGTSLAVGVAHGAASAASVVAPVVGGTLAKTAGIVMAGGPGAFMAEQETAKLILQHEGYDEIAKQYNPTDPMGLGLSLGIPLGVGAAIHGVRAVRGAKPTPSVLARTPTPEQADAARVVLNAAHIDETRLSDPHNAPAADAHVQAMEQARAQMDQGLPVDVKDIITPDMLGEPAVAAWERVKEAFQVYHGSGHDFQAFDLRKGGTGDGSQFYGEGGYVAEDRGIGEFYREMLANGNEGHLYKMEINANVEHFLHYDKPLSEQSPHVQDVLNKLAESDGADGDLARTIRDNGTGEHLYNAIAQGDPAFASEALNAAGIPGIRYLDGSYIHKATKQGTHNFVVFDDKLMRIIEKNDEPVIFNKRADGSPVFGDTNVSIVEPKKFNQRGDVTFYQHVVQDHTGKNLGTVALGWKDGQVTDLAHIEAIDQKGGMGTQVIRAILGHNALDTQVHIDNILPEARGFWEKMGATITEEDGVANGTITKKEFLDTQRAREFARAGENQNAGAQEPAPVEGSPSGSETSAGQKDPVADTARQIAQDFPELPVPDELTGQQTTAAELIAAADERLKLDKQDGESFMVAINCFLSH